ncbi:MAG: THUMP domain-containing protein [Deferrisomatales bacterium]
MAPRRPSRKPRRPPGPRVYFASCAPGVEAALHDEVRALRLGRVERQVGGVRFVGTEADGWRAVLHLRTAARVLRQVARFEAPDPDALYRGARSVDWDRLLTPDHTFAVDAKISGRAHRHSGAVALRVKDAVADWFRERHGARPSVDVRTPDLRLLVHVHESRCTLSEDLAGRPLHRRGYRVASTAAPLGECLAAALVHYSEWDGRSPFLDPQCGSGTILIEAGLRAAGVAPGLLGEGFAFERKAGFDAGRWEEMKAAARRAVRMPSRLILKGSDVDPAAVAAARANADAAGLSALVQVEVADARRFHPTPGWGATVVSNLPYGVRLEEVESLLPLYEALGRMFRERCRGYRVHLLTPRGRLPRALHLKPSRVWPLHNGGLPCRFARYDIR